MTGRLRLLHVTLVGPRKPAASVAFGSSATVVHGPSDTGKSFILHAIDYAFGASELKQVPERDGYTRVLLGLELSDGDTVTLSRLIGGNRLSVFEGDVRDYEPRDARAELAVQHNAKSANNLSRMLLADVDLDEKELRKNSRNVTRSLSFRNLMHLCLVDETAMQSETSPPTTGAFVTKTAELSLLKLLLQGTDDSHLVAEPDSGERVRLRAARVDVVDRLAGELEAQLDDVPARHELELQLGRLNEAIEDQVGTVAQLTESRGSETQELTSLQSTLRDLRREASDVAALEARFGLLHDQYSLDLERLEMVDEAGSLLDFFETGVCLFCGAAPEDQHSEFPYHGGTDTFAASVAAEAHKTRQLRSDLDSTLSDLSDRSSSLEARLAETEASVDELQERIELLDEQLEPHRDGLAALINERRGLERALGLYGQLDGLEGVRNDLETEASAGTSVVADEVDLGAVREFSDEIRARLEAWGYPEADSVRYDRSEQDMVAGDQLRSAHGKGVRALLHAAFSLGLAQYCLSRDLPHPGFVVLDSPLVTYRAPEAAEVDGEIEDSLPQSIVESFYEDIQERFLGQVVVLENTDPPEALLEGTANVAFTKNAEFGRYGFFPV